MSFKALRSVPFVKKADSHENTNLFSSSPNPSPPPFALQTVLYLSYEAFLPYLPLLSKTLTIRKEKPCGSTGFSRGADLESREGLGGNKEGGDTSSLLSFDGCFVLFAHLGLFKSWEKED